MHAIVPQKTGIQIGQVVNGVKAPAGLLSEDPIKPSSVRAGIADMYVTLEATARYAGATSGSFKSDGSVR